MWQIKRESPTLSANPTKWSNTLKQFAANLLLNYLSVFDHFVGLALKGLRVSKSDFLKEIKIHFFNILILIKSWQSESK